MFSAGKKSNANIEMYVAGTSSKTLSFSNYQCLDMIENEIFVETDMYVM